MRKCPRCGSDLRHYGDMWICRDRAACGLVWREYREPPIVIPRMWRVALEGRNKNRGKPSPQKGITTNKTAYLRFRIVGREAFEIVDGEAVRLEGAG